MRNVAILIFDDVEVLDFAGPFEVFSITGLRSGEAPFNVYTVSETETVLARNGLKIVPHFLLENCPQPDIIIIPGGGGFRADGSPFGTRKEMNNPKILDWIRIQNEKTELTLSVCTGSLLLAKAGILEGLKATTHWKAGDIMKEVAPNTELLIDERYVDNGRIILSAGISAGIDMSFYVVSKLLGKSVADEAAAYMQYDYWK